MTFEELLKMLEALYLLNVICTLILLLRRLVIINVYLKN